MIGLLKTIAIFIIIYYALKFFSRYIAPFFIKKMVDNVEKKFKEQQQNYEDTPKGNVGETVIDKKVPAKKESNNNVGDYVDYEDVDDDKNK